MTRAELEKELVKKLWEIQALIDEFDPSVNFTNLSCSKRFVQAFAYRHDEYGNVISGDYYFDCSEYRLEG